MERDKKVVIATHGELAAGFVSALKIIVGDLPQVSTICGYTSADFDLHQTIEKVMSEHDFEANDLVVCTDMMGGSVNNGFVQYLGKYPFHLITNTHLAFLVDLLLTPGGVTKEMLTDKVQEDLFNVQYINAVSNSFDEEDDL